MQVNHERRLGPYVVHVLIGPILALGSKSNVEMKQKFRQDDAQLEVC